MKIQTGSDIIRWVQSRLRFFQGDIANMRVRGLNMGYPVLGLVFSQIEYLSDLMYTETGKNSTSTINSGRFISEEMSKVNPIYGASFSKKYPFEWGKASNFGELLYLTLRSKIAHQGGSYPPFEVTAEEHNSHLHMRFDTASRLFMVHAYRMNDELQGAIQIVFSSIEDGHEDPEPLIANIIREQVRLRKYQDDLIPILDEMRKKGFIL